MSLRGGQLRVRGCWSKEKAKAYKQPEPKGATVKDSEWSACSGMKDS